MILRINVAGFVQFYAQLQVDLEELKNRLQFEMHKMMMHKSDLCLLSPIA